MNVKIDEVYVVRGQKGLFIQGPAMKNRVGLRRLSKPSDVIAVRPDQVSKLSEWRTGGGMGRLATTYLKMLDGDRDVSSLNLAERNARSIAEFHEEIVSARSEGVTVKY